MKFVRFNRQDPVHKSAVGDGCLICNKKVKDGVVVFDTIGELVYCARCIRRLAVTLEGKPQ